VLFHQAPGDFRSQPDTITALYVHWRLARDPRVIECANRRTGVSNHLEPVMHRKWKGLGAALAFRAVDEGGVVKADEREQLSPADRVPALATRLAMDFETNEYLANSNANQMMALPQSSTRPLACGSGR
jgi:hypothetical protein